MKALNLLSKLLMIIAGVIALVLGGSTAVFITEIKTEHLNNLKAASTSIVAPLINEVYELTKSSDNYHWALRVQSVNASRLFEDHKKSGVIEIIVLDTDGLVVAHNDITKVGNAIPMGIDLTEIENNRVSKKGDTYWIGEEIYTEQQSQSIGTAIVGFQARNLEENIANVLEQAMFLFLVFFLIALAIAYYFVTRQIILPIRKLVITSNAITSGDYYYSVDTTSSDEIGDLALGFQVMQKSIRSKIEDLERYKAQLETEVDKRTEEFLAAKLEAEESNRAKSRFLANMSHELRTPLNAVLGFSQILHAREFSPEKLNYLSSINSAGNTLLALINEVLDFSKIESGKMEIQYSPFSPKNLLEDVWSMFMQKAAEKDIRLVSSCSVSMPKYLLCDVFRLKQILMNLCSNAIKFTSEGQVSIHLDAIREEKSNRVTLVMAVTDTGKGIPKEQQQAIFTAFEQVKGQKTSEFGGTGLGLAITQKLTSLMEGEVKVESEGEGRGASFIVSIPELEITDQEPDATLIAADTAKTYKFSPATVLIVDDISYNRDLLISYLSAQPFEFLQAEDGEEALALLGRHTPDLVLTDLKMPKMDGHQLLQEIDKVYPEHTYAVLLITASVQDSDLIENKELCQDILSKPISQDTLLSVMAQYLDAEITRGGEQEIIVKDEVDTGYLALELLEAEYILEMAELGELSLLEEMVEKLHKKSAKQWLQKYLVDIQLDIIIDRVLEVIGQTVKENKASVSEIEGVSLELFKARQILKIAEIGDLAVLESVINSVRDEYTRQLLQDYLSEIRLDEIIYLMAEVISRHDQQEFLE